MLEANGICIAAISYDSQQILADFARRYAIGFPLLSDEGSETIRRFGIFNFNMAPGLRSYGVPHPVDFLVAPDGIVVRKYFVPNYQHRTTGSAIALREFGAASPDAPVMNLESGALAVQIGFPSAKAFAGQEVAFFARFALEPGWHIYGAPVPSGYVATAVAFEGSNVVDQKLELPPAETLNFPALGEALPVYSGSFQVIGTLVLKHPLPEGKLVLPGHLSFQQCSDTLCEPPQVLPFELALTLEPFVISERDAQRISASPSAPARG